jgi:hypothetical protein
LKTSPGSCRIFGRPGFWAAWSRESTAALGLPDHITLWSGDHCLRYLVQAAWNTPGSLLAGDEAFRRYAAQTEPPFADAVAADGRAERYAAIAEDVLQHGVAGSSAAGEQPKFLATRIGEGGPTPVIVKFSPPATDALGARVADLLVAEHLASSLLAERGVPAATTSLHHARGRTFLEVERFDRVGTSGRRGVASLMALDGAFVGKLATWPETTEALLRQRLISAADHRRARWLHLFGRLIANSDMHLGQPVVLPQRRPHPRPVPGVRHDPDALRPPRKRAGRAGLRATTTRPVGSRPVARSPSRRRGILAARVRRPPDLGRLPHHRRRERR